jgi:hypothetical protein
MSFFLACTLFLGIANARPAEEIALPPPGVRLDVTLGLPSSAAATVRRPSCVCTEKHRFKCKTKKTHRTKCVVKEKHSGKVRCRR